MDRHCKPHAQRSLGLVLAGAMLLGACASGPVSGPVAGLGNFFGGMQLPAKFKEAVARQDLDAANALYASAPEQIESKAPAEVAGAVDLLNERWRPRLSDAQSAVQDSLGSSTASLGEVRATVASARSTLSAYQALPLLRAPGRRIEAGRTLGALLANLPAERFLASRFASYDHAGAPLFFEEAGDLASEDVKNGILSRAGATVVAAIRKAPDDKASALLKAYSAGLAPADRQMAEQALVLKAAGDASGPLGFDQLARMARASQEAGLSSDPIRIVQLKADVPMDVRAEGRQVQALISPLEIEAQAAEAARSGQPAMLVIDASRTAAIATLAVPRVENVRRQVGTTQEPNPAKAEAEADLARAQAELARIEAMNAQTQSQAKDLAQQPNLSNWGKFGAIVGSAVSTVGTESARSQVRQAESRLASTPATVSKPQFADEPTVAATRVTSSVTDLVLYLVDTKSSTFRRVPMRRTDRTEEKLQGAQLQGAGTSVLQAVRPSTITVTFSELPRDAEHGASVPLSQIGEMRRLDQMAFERHLAQEQQAAEQTTAQTRTQLARLAPADGAPATASSMPASASDARSMGADGSPGGAGTASPRPPAAPAPVK